MILNKSEHPSNNGGSELTGFDFSVHILKNWIVMKHLKVWFLLCVAIEIKFSHLAHYDGTIINHNQEKLCGETEEGNRKLLIKMLSEAEAIYNDLLFTISLSHVTASKLAFVDDAVASASLLWIAKIYTWLHVVKCKIPTQRPFMSRSFKFYRLLSENLNILSVLACEVQKPLKFTSRLKLVISTN